jgi:integrase
MSDPEGALKKYLEEKDDLRAGRTPRARQSEGLRIKDLANRFLTSKQHQLDAGELAARTFAEYFAACKMIVEQFGAERLVVDLRPEDFERFKVEMPATWGPVRRGKMIQMVRTAFRYAVDEDLVDKPIKFGKQFRKPSSKVMRLHRAKNGKRMFEATELRAMLDASGLQLKTMILLACNAGFGNGDVASLPIAALDLDNGWVNFPRPKTGIERRCKLWPETVKALREVIAARPRAKDDADGEIVFLTKYGQRWVRVSTEKVEEKEKEGGKLKARLKVRCDDAVSKETKKVLKRLDINGHRNFYSIRHSFRTVADETRDQPAVDSIMGHAPGAGDMASVYRDRISDERLAEIAAHVRRWLFAESAKS